jgi:hypothetical protein
MRFVVSATLIMLSWVLFAIPGAAQQPVTVLPPHARAGLIEASGDSTLLGWQRHYMVELAGGRVPDLPATSADSATGADGIWRQLPPPSPRYLHAAVYDPVGDRMVVIGGYSSDDLLNDVWVLSLGDKPEWTRLYPAGTPPSRRHLHSAIYDPLRRRVIVFGGIDRAVGYRDDVWALSLDATPTWRELQTLGTGPSARASHSAVYDPARDRMIVFGGYGSGEHARGTRLFNDVWALSLSGPLEWRPLTPAGRAPSARYDQSAVYDPRRDRVLVFAGYDGSAPLNDIWELGLRGRPHWRALDPTGPIPEPRTASAAIYDPVSDRMLINGGHVIGLVSGTWSLSLHGRLAWTRITPAVEPMVRWGHSAIVDPVRGRMIIFGGTEYGSSLVNEIWALSLAAVPAWKNLTTPSALPLSRWGQSQVYDAVHGRMLLFGGYSEQTGLLNDTWELSLGSRPEWTLLQPSGTPPSPREGHTAIYDPHRNRMLVFAGTRENDIRTNEVWELSLSGVPAWKLLTPAGPAPEPRETHTAIYDALNDRMVVFAGVGQSSYLSDLWAMSLSGQPTWARIPAAGPPPLARFEHSAIYDPLRQRMVVFGGIDAMFSFSSELWSLSLGASPAWTLLDPPGPRPAERSYHCAIHDSARDRMIMFGGFNYSSTPVHQNEVWSLSLAKNAWSVLHPEGAILGGGQRNAAIYDSTADRMLVLGGTGDASSL